MAPLGVSEYMHAIYVAGATTLSITTLGIMTLSIKGLYVTLSVSNNQHKCSAIVLSVAFYLLLC